MTLYDYQQKIDTQLNADSDSDTDFDNDYVQYDSFTSLIDHQSHNIEDNTEYTDLNDL